MTTGSKRMLAAAAGATAVASALALGGCMPTTGVRTADDAADARAIGEIHALEFDPTDGGLLIAAHSGLWRAEFDADGLGAPQPINARIDLATIAAFPDGTLVGVTDDTGPGATTELSADSGGTWEPVESDEFAPTMLDAAGARLVGYSGEDDSIRTSDDTGKTWAEQSRADIRDLAVAAGDPSRIWVLGEENLADSSDGGGRFEKVRDTPGLSRIVAGGDADHPVELVAFGADRRVWTREGDDEAWRAKGQYVGDVSAVAYSAADAAYLAIVDDRGLLVSTDLGYRWTALTTPQGGTE